MRGQRLEQGRRVLHAVVTHADRIDHQGFSATGARHGSTARLEQHVIRLCIRRCIDGADLYRDRPHALARCIAIDLELFLAERDLAHADAFDYLATRINFHHRETRLRDPHRGDLADRFAGCLGQRGPQIGRGGIGILVLGHIGADPFAEGVLAKPGLEHAQEGLALLVGDGVERIGGLAFIGDRALDRMRGAARIEVHRGFARAVGAQPYIPVGVELRSRLGRHP